MTLSTKLARLAEAATPGPWLRHLNPKKWVSTLAPVSDEEWRTNADNDAALIISLRNNLPAIIAALKAIETPLGDYEGLVNEARLDAKAFREHVVYDSEGDPIRLTQNAARLDQYADAITALTRQVIFAEEQTAVDSEILAHLRSQLTERDAEIARLREALRGWISFGCPICNSDCSAANPPVSACIIRDTMQALKETQP